MKKGVLIVGVILTIIVAILLSAYFSGKPNSSNSAKDNKPTSEPQITYGETILLDRGVTTNQLSSLEQSLGQYLSTVSKSPSRVDFDSIVRQKTDPKISTPQTEITFNVQLDGTSTYKAKMVSNNSYTRLYLYTLDGQTLLYDSQNIEGFSE